MDDGQKIISSDIVVYSTETGKMQNITNTPNRHETYPIPSPNAKKIAFHTVKGEIYLMDIELKN